MKRMKPILSAMLLGLTISDVVWANNYPTYEEMKNELINIKRDIRKKTIIPPDKDPLLKSSTEATYNAIMEQEAHNKFCEYLLPFYEQDNLNAIYLAYYFDYNFYLKEYKKCSFAKSVTKDLLKIIEKSDDIQLKQKTLYELGKEFKEGRYTKIDLDQAKEYFSQGCDLEDEYSCSQYNRAVKCEKASNEDERKSCKENGWDW